MSTKKSAFSVFRSREKNDLPSENEDIDDVKLVDVKKVKNHDKTSLLVTTPSPGRKTPKLKSKGEQRLSSIRKSLRKKPKKEAHHEVALKQNGKENKLEKVSSYIQSLDKPNWTESLQSLNSTLLEEEFLPNVVKQREEQKKLHRSTSSLPEQQNTPLSKPHTKENTIGDKRKRSESVPSIADNSQKPPLPKKKQKAPRKSLSESLTTSDESKLACEQPGGQTSAEKLFAWLIGPVKTDQFFSDVWQKKPLFIKRRQPKYNNIWFSTKEFDKILRQQNVQYTKNLDIAIFRDGKRETLNPNGRAFAPQVWKFYEDGCSVRLLNPATFSSSVWHLSSRLQEYFGCLVGSNVYLTPPGSQGFAPHYDDIEAFVVQLEGKKRWRLYHSRDVSEILPRHSSENMSSDELGEPILDRVLEPGDALYFPRGVVHQAETPEDSHSLHMTLSVFQKCCWSDLMEKLVPMALQTAIEEDVEFRKALPVGFHTHVGMSNSEKSSEIRKNFMKTVEQLMKKLVSYVSVDQATDELILDQMDEFLPPSLTTAESERTVFANGASWEEGEVRGTTEVNLKTRFRIVREGIVRLVPAEGTLQIYNTIQNSREYKELSLNMFEIPLQYADVAEYFLFSYPEYVCVKDAPTDDDNIKLEVAREFYDRGLLITDVPLATISEG